MSRKDYPFSKRDSDFGIKLITDILSTMLLFPLTILGVNAFETTDSSCFISWKDNPKMFQNKYVHCFFASSSIISAAMGLAFYILDIWWMLFIIIVFAPIELSFCSLLFELIDGISQCFVFERDKFEKQKKDVKQITNYWLFATIVLFLITLSIFFLPNWLHREYSFLSTSLLVLLLGLKTIPLTIAIILRKTYRQLIAANASLKNIIESYKQIKTEDLLQLLDHTNDDYQINLWNGFTLKAMYKSNIYKLRFILTDKYGNSVYYCLQPNKKVNSDLLINGLSILEKTVKKINKELIKKTF